jgi:HTH-type transcriptional regulator, competence development regulator
MELMATKSERPEPSLGPYLASIRALKKMTLREVEEATGREVSNAYLSQLENGKINKPSPHILHSLAEVYGVDYSVLMERAGYIVRPTASQERHGMVPTFAIENLSQDEEKALLAYLRIYRNQSKK